MALSSSGAAVCAGWKSVIADLLELTTWSGRLSNEALRSSSQQGHVAIKTRLYSKLLLSYINETGLEGSSGAFPGMK